MRIRPGQQQPQLTDGFGLPAGLSLSMDFSFGRLTPPTKPIAFPLHVPSVTLTPNFASLSIAADNLDDLPSFFGMFPPSSSIYLGTHKSRSRSRVSRV
jgi:hypothetical protein